MKSVPLILMVCACAVLTLALPGRAAAQEPAAALVEKIEGTAFWRRNADERRERLDPKAHTARPLYPGEQVRCTRGSVLRLRMGPVTMRVPAGVWFPIPRRDLSDTDPNTLMLNTVTDVMGVDRGNPLQLFSPADHSTTPPSPFVVRWAPTPRGCKFSLVITDVGRRKVWRRDGVDGSAGFFSDRGAERALANFRATSGQGPLELHVYDSCGEEPYVTFFLLTAEKERALRRDLAFWARGAGPLIARLGRASVYVRYGMYSHAAEEYEAALRTAPDSLQLLSRTISANRRTGNLSRAAELKKRLAAATALP